MKVLSLFLFVILGYYNAFCLDSLNFSFPTPNTNFIAGSDTLITWEGISENDTVSLEFSIDNGKTWNLLSKKAVGLNNQWKNIPNKVGNGYLMRLIHKGEIDKLNEPYIEWQKTYGGSHHDELRDIKELSEGGYIAVGITHSNDYDIPLYRGKRDIWLLKTDPNGNIVFSKTFGGSDIDDPFFVKQTKDRGFIIGGHTGSNDYDFDKGNFPTTQFLIKFDSTGKIEWKKNYDQKNPFDAGFKDLQETDDGGYIVIGDTIYIHPCDPEKDNPEDIYNDHILILKINKVGGYEWSKAYGGDFAENAMNIEKTRDGGYIIVGGTNSKCGDVMSKNGMTNAFVIKLDPKGNLEWQRSYGGSNQDFAFSIKQTTKGDFLILCYATSNDYDIVDYKGGPDDIWIYKINSSGEIIWSKTYGGSSSDNPAYSFINPTSDGGFVFSGLTCSGDGDIKEYQGNGDGWFVKIDEDGNIKYQKTFGGRNSEYFTRTQQTKDKGYIICGLTYSIDGDVTENKGGYDGWILKLGVNYQKIDTVTTTFSIVAPQPVACDVDMGKVFVSERRDSTVADFVYNIGDYKFRVDSIYVKGADKTAFSLIGGFPKYIVEPDSGKEAKFRFTPNRVGMHYSEIVIITQSNTMVQKIRGEGLKKPILISTELKPFSDLICDNSTSSSVVIKSTGGDTLRIKALNLTGPDKADFSINEIMPINLPPDSSKTIAIGFKTDLPGIKTAALEIKSNAESDLVLSIPLIARKDSIALVPDVIPIDFGTLFPNQTKDSSFIISNLGTIQTDGKVTLSNNLTCANPAFTIDSGGVYKLDFTFKGLSADGNINEKITVWDEVCKYSREVLITGKIVSPHLLGFSAVQCKSYENEYKLTLQNPSSNKLKITSIEIEQNPQLFEIDPSLVFPISIEPFIKNHEVKVTYKDDSAKKFKTAVNWFTDNQFLPVLTDSIYAETVDYKRTTSGLINDTIRTASNPFAVSYDSASEFGENKFTYSIQVNEIANDMDYLTELSDIEVVINYNRNVLGADFGTQSGQLKVRLSNEISANYILKSTKETKIDELNSQIVINLENTNKATKTKDSFKLLELDFTAYLGKEGLSDEQNSDKSRSAIISHLINSGDECISYETANNAVLSIEKLCTDDIRSIKITENPDEHFYLIDVIPQPVGTTDATIEYGLGFECQVIITIYDISGAIVLTPVNEIQKSGTHKQAISRKSLSAGVYFIEMKAGQFKETKKIIVE